MSPKSRRREVHPGGPLRGFSPCAEPAVPPRPGTQRRPKSRRNNGSLPSSWSVRVWLKADGCFPWALETGSEDENEGKKVSGSSGGSLGTGRYPLCWEPPLSTSSPFPPSIISLSDCSQGPAPSLPSWLQHKWGVHFPGSVCCIPASEVLGNDQRHS